MVSYTEKDVNIITAICIFLGILSGLISGFGIAARLASDRIDEIRQEAIEANVAKWVIDEKTGEKSFRFSDKNGSVVNKTHQ